MSDYKKILDSKVRWSVSEINNFDSGRPVGNYERLIGKIIALGLTLELPVGEFVAQATKKDLPNDPACKPLLLKNIAEETQHYRVFKNASKVYQVSDSDTATANSFLSAWESQPDHPIIKAGLLELGVFLVSLAAGRIYGSQSFERSLVDINSDEISHIATNWELAADLDLSYSASLDKLRLAVVDWLFSDLNDPKYPLDFWVKQSNDYMADFEAPDLAFVNFEPHLSFFEVSAEYIQGY